MLDPETAEVLQRAPSDGPNHGRPPWAAPLRPSSYVFSGDPESLVPLNPDSVSQRYKRMADSLDIDTTLKSLRHYSATELISAGVDVRTVAGRLGHGGGGATTLRVYTAWTSEADQRAAQTVSGRMPARPKTSVTGVAGVADVEETVSHVHLNPISPQKRGGIAE